MTKLPIDEFETQICDKMNENAVLFISSSTGSGKSTRIPQFLSSKYKIIVTQPRRVAATTLAVRVNEEMSQRMGKRLVLGEMVGYAIRFDRKASLDTRILFCTDGWLLREVDHQVSRNKSLVVMLDEFHERSVRTDLLLSIFMPHVVAGRLKLVIASATLETLALKMYLASFIQQPIPHLDIPGKLFPVTVHHTATPQSDVSHSTVITILQIHQDLPPGDILVFLTGKDEIDGIKKIFDGFGPLPNHLETLLVLPFYASLSSHLQQQIFSPTPPSTRKVILATNIAETSLTIPNIIYVVDAGLAKVRGYNPKIGLESLTIQSISKDNAIQRTGRCGRIAPGHCFRLYTKESYQGLAPTLPPEIQRVNLAGVILQLLELKQDPKTFKFIDAPSRDSLLRSHEQLFALGALSNDGQLTQLGKKMARLPLDPGWSKCLIVADELGVGKHIISIVSCASADVQLNLKNFKHSSGDHMSMLGFLQSYMETKGKSWCKENDVKQSSMTQIMNIQSQLSALIKPGESRMDTDAILKALLAGFPQNIALKLPNGTYHTLSRKEVQIHPASVLFGSKPDAVMYEELIYTNRMWMRGVSRIEPSWLIEMAPHWYGLVR
jgi:HrpA-like RNA helicase